jgi:hypothetical protein
MTDPTPTPFDILSMSTLKQVLVGSAVVAFVINLVWQGLSFAWTEAARWLRLRTKSHDFVLGNAITRQKYEELSQDISGFYCLFVRYGSDDYLMKMASDEERYEGRLRLKLIPIKVQFNEKDQAVFTLTLAIHKSLGTQFKCFAQARSIERVPAVIERLKNCEHASMAQQSDSYHRDRIYLLLDQFVRIPTVDPAVTNNYIFPE